MIAAFFPLTPALSLGEREKRAQTFYNLARSDVASAASSVLPPHEPGLQSAAFTPLQRPTRQDLWIPKRRKRRAPVQGLNARTFSGKSLPGGEGRGEGK